MKSKKQIIAELLQNENVKQVKNLIVKNVNVADIVKGDNTYGRISLTLDKELASIHVDEDTKEAVEGESNIIFTSVISVNAILKEDSAISFAVPMWRDNIDAYRFVLAGAIIDILQQRVPAGEAYRNPFSSNEDGESVVWDTDKIINHVIAISIPQRVYDKVDRLADKLLGI